MVGLVTVRRQRRCSKFLPFNRSRSTVFTVTACAQCRHSSQSLFVAALYTVVRLSQHCLSCAVCYFYTNELCDRLTSENMPLMLVSSPEASLTFVSLLESQDLPRISPGSPGILQPQPRELHGDRPKESTSPLFIDDQARTC